MAQGAAQSLWQSLPMLDSFFLTGAIPPNAEFGTYNIPRVIVSYVVAAFAAHTALLFAYELTTVRTPSERVALLCGGALAMGTGIWSMHFVGMLAYRTTMVIEYDPWLTLLSFLIAAGAAYGALHIISGESLSVGQILEAGTLLGFAICGMHYTGMAAMKMDADLRYLPGLFALSVAIAIAASWIALWMAFTLARRDRPDRVALNIGAALVMGGAVAGMHYTGMAAAIFIPFADCRRDPHQTFNLLAAIATGMTALILLLANALVAYRGSRSEFRLRTSESKLRAVFEGALDAIITIDDKGRVTEWNPQAEKIFGWPRSQVLGQPMAPLIVPPAQREAHYAGMQRFLKDRTANIIGRRLEMDAQHQDGTIFPVEMAVIAREARGRFTFTAFMRDISVQKRAEAERDANIRALEISNRELDEFAHLVSHDLKEPVRGIQNQASFLLEDLGDRAGEEGKRRLLRLVAISERMQQLISDLLYFSRLGREEIAVQPTDFNEVLDDIVHMLEDFIEERHARVHIPRPLPVVHCDKTRVKEALRNLITNAIKYNDKEQPIVEIGYLNELEANGAKQGVFYVKDNGMGIPPEAHDQIFQIFKRLETESGSQQSGTGAGLTFVKRIVERHGGRIWLHSTVGEGTTFYFTLPGRLPSEVKRAA
jgi:PAS domain S-box-containing protein